MVCGVGCVYVGVSVCVCVSMGECVCDSISVSLPCGSVYDHVIFATFRCWYRTLRMLHTKYLDGLSMGRMHGIDRIHGSWEFEFLIHILTLLTMGGAYAPPQRKNAG